MIASSCQYEPTSSSLDSEWCDSPDNRHLLESRISNPFKIYYAELPVITTLSSLTCTKIDTHHLADCAAGSMITVVGGPFSPITIAFLIEAGSTPHSSLGASTPIGPPTVPDNGHNCILSPVPEPGTTNTIGQASSLTVFHCTLPFHSYKASLSYTFRLITVMGTVEVRNAITMQPPPIPPLITSVSGCAINQGLRTSECMGGEEITVVGTGFPFPQSLTLPPPTLSINGVTLASFLRLTIHSSTLLTFILPNQIYLHSPASFTAYLPLILSLPAYDMESIPFDGIAFADNSAWLSSTGPSSPPPIVYTTTSSSSTGSDGGGSPLPIITGITSDDCKLLDLTTRVMGCSTSARLTLTGLYFSQPFAVFVGSRSTSNPIFLSPTTVIVTLEDPAPGIHHHTDSIPVLPRNEWLDVVISTLAGDSCTPAPLVMVSSNEFPAIVSVHGCLSNSAFFTSRCLPGTSIVLTTALPYDGSSGLWWNPSSAPFTLFIGDIPCPDLSRLPMSPYLFTCKLPALSSPALMSGRTFPLTIHQGTNRSNSLQITYAPAPTLLSIYGCPSTNGPNTAACVGNEILTILGDAFYTISPSFPIQVQLVANSSTDTETGPMVQLDCDEVTIVTAQSLTCRLPPLPNSLPAPAPSSLPIPTTYALQVSTLMGTGTLPQSLVFDSPTPPSSPDALTTLNYVILVFAFLFCPCCVCAYLYYLYRKRQRADEVSNQATRVIWDLADGDSTGLTIDPTQLPTDASLHLQPILLPPISLSRSSSSSLSLQPDAGSINSPHLTLHQLVDPAVSTKYASYLPVVPTRTSSTSSTASSASSSSSSASSHSSSPSPATDSPVIRMLNAPLLP